MDDMKIRQLSMPIITGNPPKQQNVSKGQSTKDFHEVLMKQLAESGGPAFSRHAASRVMERDIDVSKSSLDKLSEGMRLAEEKGLKEPLILVDGTAFIVSVTNNTVITTVKGNDLKGNVFTNIDGTVII